MAKQFDRAEPGERGPHKEPCQQDDAAVGANSKDGEDGPDREKILRVSYARRQRYQGRESRAHIGPLLVPRLLLLRQAQEHAPADDEQQRDPAQNQNGALKQRIFEHLQRSDCAAEKVGDDEEHRGDNEITDRAARDDRGRHCAPLLDAKMQTPQGNRTGWEPDGGAGHESQQAALQAPQPDCIDQIWNGSDRAGCRQRRNHSEPEAEHGDAGDDGDCQRPWIGAGEIRNAEIEPKAKAADRLGLREYRARAEPNRKGKNDAEDSACDGAQCRVDVRVVAKFFDERANKRNPQEWRDGNDPYTEQPTQCRCRERRQHAVIAVCREEADELLEQDHGPRRQLGERKTVQCLLVREPTVGLYRMQRDIAVDGVWAAQGQRRHLAEQNCDLAEHIIEAQRSDQHSDRDKPKREPERGDAKQATRGRPGVLRQIVLMDVFSGLPYERAVDALSMPRVRKCRRPHERSAEADHGGANDDGHEGQVEEKSPDKRQSRERNHQPGSEHLPSDSNRRLEHDDQDGWLESIKQHLADRGITAADVSIAQRHHADHGRQDDEATCEHAAQRAVHDPADIGREQLRVGAGQRQAIVQSIEKPVSGDPALFLNEDAVHGGELDGGTSEAQQGNARPDAERLAQGRRIGSADGNVFGGRLQAVSFAVTCDRGAAEREALRQRSGCCRTKFWRPSPRATARCRCAQNFRKGPAIEHDRLRGWTAITKTWRHVIAQPMLSRYPHAIECACITPDGSTALATSSASAGLEDRCRKFHTRVSSLSCRARPAPRRRLAGRHGLRHCRSMTTSSSWSRRTRILNKSSGASLTRRISGNWRQRVPYSNACLPRSTIVKATISGCSQAAIRTSAFAIGCRAKPTTPTTHSRPATSASN